jgi:hypothetical protein
MITKTIESAAWLNPEDMGADVQGVGLLLCLVG